MTTDAPDPKSCEPVAPAPVFSMPSEAPILPSTEALFPPGKDETPRGILYTTAGDRVPKYRITAKLKKVPRPTVAGSGVPGYLIEPIDVECEIYDGKDHADDDRWQHLDPSQYGRGFLVDMARQLYYVSKVQEGMMLTMGVPVAQHSSQMEVSPPVTVTPPADPIPAA